MRVKFLLFCLLLSLVNYSVAQNNSEENQLISVEVAGKWGYIDKTGKMVILPQFGNALSFAENGLAAVIQNGKYGVIDSKGKIVVKPRFEGIEIYRDILFAKDGGKWGIIDTKGAYIAKPQFDRVGLY